MITLNIAVKVEQDAAWRYMAAAALIGIAKQLQDALSEVPKKGEGFDYTFELEAKVDQ